MTSCARDTKAKNNLSSACRPRSVHFVADPEWKNADLSVFQQSILPSPERFVYRRYSNRCHNNRHVDCGPLNERKRRSLWNSVLFLHWGGIKLWTYGFLFHTAEQQKNANATDIKKMHSQISALWRVVPKLAVCYTHLKCGNVYEGLHVFLNYYGSRLHHLCVQFDASLTKHVGDKIKEGTKCFEHLSKTWSN